MGKFRPDYDVMLKLVSDGRVQIRHNALEAARVAASKKMQLLGDEGFYLRVVTYPHQILSENKMIATAGADRLQEGMRKAYGKPIGLAARVNHGSVIFEMRVKTENLAVGKSALEAAIPWTRRLRNSMRIWPCTSATTPQFRWWATTPT